MKNVLWLSLVWLLAADAFAQHRGGWGGGFGRGGFGKPGIHVRAVPGGFGFQQQGFTNFGIPPLGPIPSLAGSPPLPVSDRRFPFTQGRFGPSVFFSSGIPVVAGGVGYGYAPAPNIIIVQQPASQTIAEEKPREVRPEIREYKEGALPPPASREEEPAVFVIVLKDGSLHSAVVVWVQESVVHYVDPEGVHRQEPLSRVDREATRRLNRQRNLNLSLPAPAA